MSCLGRVLCPSYAQSWHRLGAAVIVIDCSVWKALMEKIQLFLREPASCKMQADDIRKNWLWKELAQKRDLTSHHAYHGIPCLGKGVFQVIGLAKSPSQTQFSFIDVCPEPLIDKGIGVGQWQGAHCLGYRFTALKFMQQANQVLGTGFVSKNEFRLACAAGSQQPETISAVPCGDQA